MRFNTMIYDLFMYPFESYKLGKIRRKVLQHARGHLLEIGVGTGVNLKYLPYHQIDSLTGLDMDMKDIDLPKHMPEALPYCFIDGDVTHLPFPDDTFDTVLFSLVFCSVDHPEQGLGELYRVLKSGGRLIFIEHVLPTHKVLKPLFNRLTPGWKRVAHGCHLNRETLTTIKEAGFRIKRYKRFYKTSFIAGIGYKP